MCVIVDTCTVYSVFDPEAKNRFKYLPIVDWLANRNGKIIIGGSKYEASLGHVGRKNCLRNLNEHVSWSR